MKLADQEFVNDALNEQARLIRQDIPMRRDPGDLEEYIRCWSEEDVLDGKPCRALVVILKTRGCAWAIAGGCTMCGYANESAWSKVSIDQLVTQFMAGWKKYRGEELVKIYTSGSFTDDKEVMPEARDQILAAIAKDGRVVKMAFESLPVFLTDDTLGPMAKHGLRLEVGIGVESSSDRVLKDSINKGHAFAVYPDAAAACKRNNVGTKAYLMAKPPFLKECDALTDATQTIIDAAPYSDVVSLNPTNIQGRTVVDMLHRRGSYRAPWLWTLVHALLEGDKVARDAGYEGIIKSDVIAAGQNRGAHNCGECDERIVKYMKKYKATQDRHWLEMCLEKVQCDCRNEWLWTIEIGHMVPAYAQF